MKKQTDIGEKTNIVLITTDQQRFDTIGAYGFDFAKTPNLDTLANDCTMYSQAYSPNPACVPARHNIITGLPCRYHTFAKNYFENETQIPYDIPTFPHILSDQGYDTIAIGKMHFSPTRRSNGFNKLYLMEEIPRYRDDDEYAQYLEQQDLGNIQSLHGVRHLLYMYPQQSLIPEMHHGSKWVANKTIEAIRLNRGTRPFMLWSSFIEPHPPFDVPEEFSHLYDDVDLPDMYESDTPVGAIAEENKTIAQGMTQEQLRRAKQLYYCAVSYVDHQVGRIIKELKSAGLYDDTMIIFTSDHGEMLGDNGTFQKFLPYDASTHVPMMVKFPKNRKGTVPEDSFVDLNDLLPTILDVAGCPYPAEYHLPGESLLAPNPEKDRSLQYVEYQMEEQRWVSLRTHEYKYNYYYGGGKEELFHLSEDAREQRNLLADKNQEARSIADMLRKKLIELEYAQGLPGGVENGDFVIRKNYEPSMYAERNFPIFPSHLSAEESRNMIGLVDEMIMATKNEPTVHLNDFNLTELPGVQ